MAIFYIASGVNHFRKPLFYRKLIPAYLPHKMTFNEIAGVLQIIFGLYLFLPSFAGLSAWFILLLLLLLLPANFYVCFSKKVNLGLPKWVLFLSIPMQFLLMFWAYNYTIPLNKIF